MKLIKQLNNIDSIIKEKQKLLEKDALFNVGGSSTSGLGFSGNVGNVPWNSHAPWAVTQDSDGDGVPDAFDKIYGPGQ